jgi:hypothetical protein
MKTEINEFYDKPEKETDIPLVFALNFQVKFKLNNAKKKKISTSK